MAQMARVNFVCVTVMTCLHSNRNICMIIVQLCTVDCIVYCCKQHRSLYRPLYSVKTTDIVCRRPLFLILVKHNRVSTYWVGKVSQECDSLYITKI